jgi:TRAP-type C4-dicarboxylate transport system permease small subunit
MLLKKLNLVLGYTSGFLFFLTAVIMLFDVFSRYILGAPSVWAQSISQYMILTAAFLGTSYCLQSGGHVHVEILVDRVKPIVRKILLTIGYLFALTFVGALTKSTYDYALLAYEFKWDAMGNIPFPSVILYGIMIFGCIMLMLTLIAKLIACLRATDEKGGN